MNPLTIGHPVGNTIEAVDTVNAYIAVRNAIGPPAAVIAGYKRCRSRYNCGTKAVGVRCRHLATPIVVNQVLATIQMQCSRRKHIRIGAAIAVRCTAVGTDVQTPRTARRIVGRRSNAPLRRLGTVGQHPASSRDRILKITIIRRLRHILATHSKHHKEQKRKSQSFHNDKFLFLPIIVE